MYRRLARQVRALVEVGVTPELTDSLQKRIRLTNVLALFGAFVAVASIPFDYLEAPRWMLVEDVLGGLAYLGLLLVNRQGFITASRLLCLALSNLVVLSNVALLGPESGAPMVFIALCAIPFTLFDPREWRPLALGVLVPIGCFALAQSDGLAPLRHLSDNYTASTYRVYSATITFLVLLFCLFQTSRANAAAEEALRTDIDERRRAEHDLKVTRESAAYSAKMAALGEMSGNIAHEVNNPLTAILFRAQMLRRLLVKGQVDVAAVNKTATQIEATADRIRRIVDALRTFARDAEGDAMRPEAVFRIVQSTVDLCTKRFQHHAIELRVDPIPPDLTVECRGIQISQILLNLLSNAHDAVVNQPVRWVRITAECTDREVHLAVIDSGPGIPPALEPRIMTPFFTTKDVGKGTGLGLSVSKGIAEANNGRLVYDAQFPETRFVLTLARTSDVPQPIEGMPSAPWVS